MKRTGRTTRMLEEAKRLAEAGRAVYVVFYCTGEAAKMQREHPEFRELGIKFESPASVQPFDWKQMRTRGSHPNCVFLVDHYTIETEFELMLDALHRFDLPPEAQKTEEQRRLEEKYGDRAERRK